MGSVNVTGGSVMGSVNVTGGSVMGSVNVRILATTKNYHKIDGRRIFSYNLQNTEINNKISYLSFESFGSNVTPSNDSLVLRGRSYAE